MMSNTQDHKSKVKSFRGIREDPYPVFKSELEYIAKKRVKKDKPASTDKADATADEKVHPTTRHNLVGLCLSGGGIRSATFNLGFMQALFRRGILKRADYLSTVSGGGYIGSCLTALLSSGTTENQKVFLNADLLDDNNFPFAKPRKKCEDTHDTLKKAGDDENKKDSDISAAAEKTPVRHLRYFSNYITAEGNVIQKYFAPFMVFIRGLVLNLLIILPYPLIAAVLIALFFSLPVPHIGKYPLYISIQSLEHKLTEYDNAKNSYEKFIIQSTGNSPDLTLEERIVLIRADDARAGEMTGLKKEVDKKEDLIRTEWWTMLRIPLTGLAFMSVCALLLMPFYASSFNGRFKFSYVFSWVLFASLAALVIQLFGFSIVYWDHYDIPNKLAFLSVISFLGPKLLGRTSDLKESDKKPWGKIIVTIGLMSLVPLILLYFTGFLVHYLIYPLEYPMEFTKMTAVMAVGLLLLVLTNLLMNINKISLHNFYRDRLSRAYLIQHDTAQDIHQGIFERTVHNDVIKLSKIYEDSKTLGPYHIINANLNLSKKMPGEGKEGVIRSCESFIFSKYWCGSRKTGFIKTEDYEKKDSHLDLGTAMAISGAAANIGMGQTNMPVFRFLMGLMNIRLGYWAPNPEKCYSENGKKWGSMTPGGLTAMKEWIGLYSPASQFINLSDGGHFDNIGVYELLRRRCKYIIVGDAEADTEMKFQALSYIIRLARIDFGINIDIDISDLKPDRETGLSRRHCVVGTIEYPENEKCDPEIGYLLYCKSSLTGDEPQHLHEYRIKHPDFPHQTTADQWFDEQQFEVYRELGYHIGRRTFDPVPVVDDKTNLEDIFIQLRQFWYPHSEAVARSFTRHTSELNRIVEVIKKDDNLHFMDAQMFPEWESLMKGTAKRTPLVDLWLPDRMEEIRAGFYTCNLMIQLMENVYLDLNLEKMYDHPDNRGWMNLFMHWAWAGIFRVTWSISGCTFGAKFQKFCEKRLNLGMGDMDIKKICGQFIPVNTDGGKKLSSQIEEELSQYLNPYEIMLLEKLLTKYDKAAAGRTETPTCCYAFRLKVTNPLNREQFKEFGFGFALTDNNTNRILYFRIQDHLRRMGLGRKALVGLVDMMITESPEKLPPALPDWLKVAPEGKSFSKMLDSVMTEIGR